MRVQRCYPDISTVKLFDMLRKQRDGALRYVHNQVIVLISEAHLIDAGEGVTMYNIATVYSEGGNEIPFATTFAEGFVTGTSVWRREEPT
jgi:hypothetical protein